MPRRAGNWALLALLAPAAGGCTPMAHFPYVQMIDQRTFASTAVAPEAGAVKALPDRPLAVIRFDNQPDDYRPDLSDMVATATARKPDVEFNVTTPVAIGQIPGPRAEADAAIVARAIAEQQVLTERIHLGVVEEPGNPAREVRVYVR
jgi:hypothetical protein